MGGENDSLESRSLPPTTDPNDIHYYRLKKPLEVTAGYAAPWFGEKGGAEQYVVYKEDGKTLYSIEELFDEYFEEEK